MVGLLDRRINWLIRKFADIEVEKKDLFILFIFCLIT